MGISAQKPDAGGHAPAAQSPDNPPGAFGRWSELVICAVVFAAFSPCLQARFVNWDDPAFLLENPVVRNLSTRNIFAIFAGFHADYYAPLVFLSFALERAVWGFNPVGYHAVNILLHCGSACLAFRLLKSLRARPIFAFWFSLAWAVHPMKVESAAWITERKDVLCGFFTIASLVSYTGFIRSNRRSRYMASLGLALAALMCKGMALTIPLILVIIDGIEGASLNRRRMIEKLPFFALSVIFGIITYIAQERGEVTSSSGILNIGNNLLIAAYSVCFHLGRLLLPVRLSAVYSLPAPISIGNFIYASSLLITIGAAFLIILRRQSIPSIAMGFAWFYAAFFPVAQFIPLRIPLADRYMYLPSLALAWTICAVMQKRLHSAKAKRLAQTLAGMIVLLLALASFNRAHVWRDSPTLWQDVLAGNPDQWEAHLNLGHYYANRSNPDPAKAAMHYEIALRNNPQSDNAAYNLGNIRMRAGRYEEAAALFQRALSIRPGRKDAKVNLACCRVQMGRFEEAISIYDRLIVENPNLPEPLYSRASVLLHMGRLNDAELDCRRALEIDPGCAPARETLSRIAEARRNASDR
ncbi:MAG TPA: tetratricopeptide repeat protein [Candidatus Brocadiia bacterium]|nr:tetratricopeptide repeat protein [Candidatus Brocadiia bacterium]